MNFKSRIFSLLGTAGILLIISVFAALKYSWVSADAPYYLSIARDISEGGIMYKNVINDYTPFVMVFFSAIFRMIENPGYSWFLAAQLFIIVLNGLLLFAILSHLKLSRLLSILVSISFCIAILSSDGNYINLEVFSIFFVLVSIRLLIHNANFLIIGILLGCSFLCKQYGVLNFIPIFFYILTKDEALTERIKKASLISVGGILVLAGFLGYYTLIRDVKIMELLQQISGVGYSQVSVSRERNLLSILIGAKIFILFGSIPLMYVIQQKKLSKELLFCLVGIVSCLVPVYLRGYQHYYINTFPYLFIAIGIVLAHVNQQRIERWYLATLVVMVMVSSGMLLARVTRYAYKKNEQREIANKVSEVVPRGSSIFIKGDLRYLYVLNNYRNPLLDTVGYDYMFNDMNYVLNREAQAVLSTESFQLEQIDLMEIKTSHGSVFVHRPRK